MSITKYEEEVSQEAQGQFLQILESVAPEYIFEMLGDFYGFKEGKINRVAHIAAMFGVDRLTEELPGYPDRQKDFPSSNETIGQMVDRLWTCRDASSLSELVDNVIRKKVIDKMIADWGK